jgi:hypothetical protein
MTFSALRIANFKAFGPAQRIPLRPITLLYGANSAGKSSVLHALALAHHAIETGELDTQRTQIGGESIDLGGFRQYVHRRRRERQVELGFELDPGRLSGRVAELLRAARGVVVELGIGGGFASEQPTLSSDAARDLDREGGVRVERFAVEVDGQPLLSMSARREGRLRLDRLDHAHAVFREVFRGILTLATTTQEVREEDFSGLAEVLDGLVPGITARRHGLFPRIEDDPEGTEVEGASGFLAISRGRRQEDLAQAAKLFLPRVLRELVGGLSAALEGEIRRLLYLGPLRSYPPRHLAFSQHHDPNWFAGGGYAWDVVRTRADVRARVNQWLGDPERLKTPYELEVRELVPASALPAELAPKLEATLRNWALRQLEEEAAGDLPPGPVRLSIEPLDRDAYLEQVIDIDTEAVTEEWAKEVIESRGEALQDLVLVDKRSGTIVSHRDVGIGVSQVLPVLVSAYASRGRLLAVEQPEIHLHPALQSELGDVVLESALGGAGNSFLIETHSEHLLLRIMRRMRETAADNLPEGVSPVRPEDVIVLFVEADGPQSIVREMPLNERGELVKAWPGGFFEEGMREIF